MITAKQPSSAKLEKRRKFLSQTAAIGGLAMLGTAVTPAQAGRKRKKIRLGNAKIKDFMHLVGKKFKIRAEDGTRFRARLIDAEASSAEGALRFRREHFSIVFDVPESFKCVCGKYRIKHSKLGSLDVFMSPVDMPDKFNRLEAVFT